jgi:hypothetical protein
MILVSSVKVSLDERKADWEKRSGITVARSILRQMIMRDLVSGLVIVRWGLERSRIWIRIVDPGQRCWRRGREGWTVRVSKVLM